MLLSVRLPAAQVLYLIMLLGSRMRKSLMCKSGRDSGSSLDQISIEEVHGCFVPNPR